MPHNMAVFFHFASLNCVFFQKTGKRGFRKDFERREKRIENARFTDDPECGRTQSVEEKDEGESAEISVSCGGSGVPGNGAPHDRCEERIHPHGDRDADGSAEKGGQWKFIPPLISRQIPVRYRPPSPARNAAASPTSRTFPSPSGTVFASLATPSAP